MDRYGANDPFFSQEEEEQLKPGQILNEKYRLVERIRAQSGKEIWKAVHLQLSAFTELFILPSSFSSRSGAILLLQKKIEETNELSHSGIATLFSLEQNVNIGWFLVSETSVSYSLREYLEEKQNRRSLTTKEIQTILEQCANALDYAHEHDVIHGNVCPENIFLMEENNEIVTAKIGYFGVDSLIFSSSLPTKNYYLYAPPELVRNEPLTPSTDQYSLALTARTLYTGSPLWNDKSLREIRDALLQECPPQIKIISPEKNEVLQKALAKYAEDRFSSCTELIDALEPDRSKSEDNLLYVVRVPGSSISHIFTFVLLLLLCLFSALFYMAYQKGLLNLYKNNPGTEDSFQSTVLNTHSLLKKADEDSLNDKMIPTLDEINFWITDDRENVPKKTGEKKDRESGVWIKLKK